MGRERREEEVMSVQVSRTNKRTKLQKKRDHNHNKSKVPCASISFFWGFFLPVFFITKKKSQEETDTIYITSEFTAAQMSSATGVSNPTRHGSRRRPPASDCSSDPRRSRAGRSSGCVCVWGGVPTAALLQRGLCFWSLEVFFCIQGSQNRTHYIVMLR